MLQTYSDTSNQAQVSGAWFILLFSLLFSLDVFFVACIATIVLFVFISSLSVQLLILLHGDSFSLYRLAC